MFTPAYLPAGDVTVVPSKPTNCGPVHPDGKLFSTKFPEASENVLPEHGVVPPLPFDPSIVTFTFASEVSGLSLTTVRPTKLVVIGRMVNDALAFTVTGMPSMVADAVMLRLRCPVGW